VGYYFLCLVFLLAIRHGTMATAADPYDQPVLVLAGVALALSLVAATFGNYVYGWHFPTALTAWVVPAGTLAFIVVLFVSKSWQIQPPGTDFGDMQNDHAVAMTFFGVLILTAFAVLATPSARMTLLLCAAIYVLGLLSDHYLGRAATGGAWLYNVLYAAVPNFQFFWAGDALTQQRIIPVTQVAHVAVYSVAYALGVLGLGVALFERREVG
jgi:cytochrome bd-type quinol oxidase subunit 1